MPSTNKSLFSSSLAATQTHDPFAVLSDLEITLVLSFLSVEETISIRRVSTLWKVTVDFRLSKAAIGRHFRGATEANAAYSNWEEEALAFRKLAHFRGTRAKPSIARRFDTEVPGAWCICDHHMVWADKTHINIQRLWDPNNPACDKFPVKRKDLKLVQFEDKPNRVRYLKVRWVAGDSKNGIAVFYLGVPFKEKPTHPRWLLAVSVATGKVLWHQKHLYQIRCPNLTAPRNDTTLVSFGHGKLCFIDSGDHPLDHSQCVMYCVASDRDHNDLVVINIFTGTQNTRKLMPNNHFSVSQGLHSEPWGECYAAHPTKEVYFLLMGRELWVFSTRTGDRIESYSLPFGSLGMGGGHQWHTSSFHFRDDGRTWLLVETYTSILGYEIEVDKFQVIGQRNWSLALNDNCIERLSQVQWQWKRGIQWSTQLDPISGVAYVVERWQNGNQYNAFRVIAVEFEPTDGTPDYHIKSCELLTLPAKKKDLVTEAGVKKSETHGVLAEVKDKIELKNGRREFKVPPWGQLRWRLFWMTGPYIAMGTDIWPDHWVYVFGFVPRW